MRWMKKTIFLWGLLLFCLSIAPVGAYAVPKTELTIKTVIDNINEVGSDVKTKAFTYNVKQVVDMERFSKQCLVPYADAVVKGFTWKHNQTQTITFSASPRSGNPHWFFFAPAGGTHSQISLTKVEFGYNTGSYTYNDGGKAPVVVKDSTWAQVLNNNKGKAEVVLHFRYNPTIGEVANDPEPKVIYNKMIDYLGDGAHNPDTNVKGANDYRLYLTLETEKKEKDKDKDIIFVLDTSGSMGAQFGNGKTRFQQMKETVISATEVLMKNPNNRVSIVRFSKRAEEIIRNSSNKAAVISAVNKLNSPYGTNYYEGLTMSGNILRSLVDPNRETVVFFITDGEPTGAEPGVNASTINSRQYDIVLIYAMEAARSFPTVDRFYSVFMGSGSGSASKLQTITQRVNVKNEKYMIQAKDSQEMKNTFDRFLSKVGGSLFDVEIEDQLSQYVEYTGESKVVQVTDGVSKTLVQGRDYQLTYDSQSKKVNMKLIGNTAPDSRYILSFNVRASEQALAEYDINNAYPNVGDSGTDYPGNATSSGKRGFFSNAVAKLKYKFDGGRPIEKVYAKPVIQLVKPNEIPVLIEPKKVLTGKELQKDQFEFELYEETPQGKVVIGTAKNEADGTIKFDSLNVTRAGKFTYRMREIIPSTPELGMTYDETVFDVNVTVVWENNVLVVKKIEYPKQPTFVNKYEPLPVSVTLKAEKELVGRALKNNEFEFTLAQAGSSVLQSKRNTSGGNVTFDPIKFTKVGEYEYTIREAVPTPSDKNIRYDMTIKNVTVKVTDAGGYLVADVSYTPDNIFRNEFFYPPVKSVISLKKVLTGMRLDGLRFDFELKDMQTGETVVVQNLNNGDILYPDIEFKDPGVYKFEVRELLPKNPDKYMTYDTKKVIKVTVTVTDDGSGTLVTQTDYTPEAVFYNSYKIRGGIW